MIFNKKAQMIWKIISWVIPIVVLIIFLVFYYGSEGSFASVREALDAVKENVGVGVRNLSAESPELPQEHKEAVNYLRTVIEQTANSKDDECFANYQLSNGGSNGNGLPELNEKGTSIIFEKYEDGMRMILVGGVSGKQEIARYDLPKINPCVISSDQIPKNFYYTELVLVDDEENPILENYDSENIYHPVDNILISYNNPTFGFSENRIFYDNVGPLDFEDSGFLFKKDNHICFFPTSDGGNSCNGNSAVGLDDDCLKDIATENSIPNLLSRGELQWCR